MKPGPCSTRLGKRVVCAPRFSQSKSLRMLCCQVGDKKFTNFNDVRDEIERQTDQVAGASAAHIFGFHKSTNVETRASDNFVEEV